MNHANVNQMKIGIDTLITDIVDSRTISMI
jgi:hypothetical protein